MEDVAELPAEHSVAGEGHAINHHPECAGALLVVCSQDAWCMYVKECQTRCRNSCVGLSNSLIHLFA